MDLESASTPLIISLLVALVGFIGIYVTTRGNRGIATTNANALLQTTRERIAADVAVTLQAQQDKFRADIMAQLADERARNTDCERKTAALQDRITSLQSDVVQNWSHQKRVETILRAVINKLRRSEPITEADIPPEEEMPDSIVGRAVAIREVRDHEQS